MLFFVFAVTAQFLKFRYALANSRSKSTESADHRGKGLKSIGPNGQPELIELRIRRLHFVRANPNVV